MPRATALIQSRSSCWSIRQSPKLSVSKTPHSSAGLTRPCGPRGGGQHGVDIGLDLVRFAGGLDPGAVQDTVVVIGQRAGPDPRLGRFWVFVLLGVGRLRFGFLRVTVW
jgi:hypothetical protein